MFGNTLVLPLSTGNVTLIKINQDNYSSVYRFADSISEFRVSIRHSKVPAKGTKQARDRHNFELVQTIFATPTVPEYERKFYFVKENLPNDVSVVNDDAIADWCIATVSSVVNGNLVSLVNWES